MSVPGEILIIFPAPSLSASLQPLNKMSSYYIYQKKNLWFWQIYYGFIPMLLSLPFNNNSLLIKRFIISNKEMIDFMPYKNTIEMNEAHNWCSFKNNGNKIIVEIAINTFMRLYTIQPKRWKKSNVSYDYFWVPNNDGYTIAVL